MKALGSNRFTRDLDALGAGIDKDEVEKLVPLALDADIQDGFWFGDTIPTEKANTSTASLLQGESPI